jgi:pentatricopeptide repeat protein
MGKTLSAEGEYKQAIVAFKRMLQVGWVADDF